jgi:hypothetical protein
MLEAALREHKAGLVLAVYVVPRSSRTGLAGMHGGALRVRVRAAPVEDAANEELLSLLASLLGLPVSTLSVMAGQSGRRKLILVRGLTRQVASARLQPVAEKAD